MALKKTPDPISTSYFAYFALIGVLMPYLPPTLLHMGFRRSEIGLLQGCIAAFAITVPTLVGRLTDRWSTADRSISLCLFMTTVGAALLWAGAHAGSVALILALLLFSASRAPINSLHDAIALQAAQGDARRYARFRVMGSLGFIVASSMAGWIVADQPHLFFPTLFSAAAIAWIVATRLPKQPRAAREGKGAAPFFRQLGWTWWGWLVAMMLHWFALGPYHYGFSFLLEERGVPPHLRGLAWGLAVAAEVCLFLVSGTLLSRLAHRQVLFIAMASGLLRWTLLGLWPQPAVIWLTQLLHGPGFALFYAGAMQGIDRFAAGRLRASYQGLFSTAIGGVAAAAGVMTAGALHERMPLNQVMLWMVPAQLLAIVFLWRNPLQKAQRASPPTA